MSDGTVKTLDAADYTVGDVDMSAVGTKTVTVALKANDQLTTSFVVTVSAKTEPGKPGSGDGSGDGAGGDNGNAGTGADSGLPSSGAAVLGLGGAVSRGGCGRCPPAWPAGSPGGSGGSPSAGWSRIRTGHCRPRR